VALASRGVVLSLADVTFMDSSVIRALVVGDEELLQSGRRLVLYVDTGSVAGRVLELCRRNEMLCFAETLPQAILVAKQAPDVIPAA
jgi:anti-anti-sigma regulatory factor